MDIIQVGDRVTYKYNDEIYIKIILDEYELSVIKDDDREILKIERPKYEVVEEKKELLTKEERETLKDMIDNIRKFGCMPIEMIKILDCNTRTLVKFYTTNILVSDILINLHFENLEKNREYTLKELGLEEI